MIWIVVGLGLFALLLFAWLKLVACALNAGDVADDEWGPMS